MFNSSYVDKTQNPLNLYTTKDKTCLTSLTKLLNFSSKQIRNKWCKQLLYKLHIIHNEFENAQCNVCLDNLKVDNNKNLVLVNVFENLTNDTKLGTDTKFKAPELLNCNEGNKSGDVWAAGICVYYVINFSFPWQIADEKDAEFRLRKSKGKFASTAESSFVPMLTQMLCIDPSMRASTKEVLKYCWDSKADAVILSKFYLCCIC